jgi:hypothetical protein
MHVPKHKCRLRITGVRFDVFTAVAMKNTVAGMVSRVAVVKSDVSGNVVPPS